MLKRRVERLEAAVKPVDPEYYWFYRFGERRDVYAVRTQLLARQADEPLSAEDAADLARIEYLIADYEADFGL